MADEPIPGKFIEELEEDAPDEWRYVSLRRYIVVLEHSVDQAIQWAAFEPNDERLWARVRQSVEEILRALWNKGALVGSCPDEAFIVWCDRTTMTQSDIDRGRLVCVVGVAPNQPAEFVNFRIGQLTGDACP